MMKNKVLIRLIVPEIDSEYDLFIPVNELIWKIKKLIVKSVSDLSGGVLDPKIESTIINKLTCQVYSNNSVVIDTDIRNGTELILLFIKWFTLCKMYCFKKKVMILFI